MVVTRYQGGLMQPIKMLVEQYIDLEIDNSEEIRAYFESISQQDYDAFIEETADDIIDDEMDKLDTIIANYIYHKSNSKISRQLRRILGMPTS